MCHSKGNLEWRDSFCSELLLAFFEKLKVNEIVVQLKVSNFSAFLSDHYVFVAALL